MYGTPMLGKITSAEQQEKERRELEKFKEDNPEVFNFFLLGWIKEQLCCCDAEAYQDMPGTWCYSQSAPHRI